MATNRPASTELNGTKHRQPRTRTAVNDAVALLKADHRQVIAWFQEFEGPLPESDKLQLAQKICEALTAHTMIEEEIFYPAFLDATGDREVHHQAEVEHDAARKLIAEIEDMDASDEYLDSKVKVLSEMIRHHVNEEERRGGMFAKAKASSMDLVLLGGQMAERKAEITGELEREPQAPPRLT